MVRFVMDNAPGAAMNDNILLINYWSAFDNIQTAEDVYEATKADTILRAKRSSYSRR
jgi:hypothetical protein